MDRSTWRLVWRDRAFQRALWTGLVAVVVIGRVLPHFFQWIADRPGLVPPDPVLAAWAPRDVSVATFAVLYGTLLFVLLSIVRRPVRIVHGLHAYAILMLLRMGSMALITLEPPSDVIPLIDPITRVFYPGNTPFLKDLFFSGHTATLALMVSLAGERRVRWVAVAGTVAVALLILVQHVHWTIDVIVAPFAAWGAWALGRRTLRWCGVVISPSGEDA